MSVHATGRLKKPFFTPGVYVLLAFFAIGMSFGLARFLTGLGTVTNLSTSFPWGIWIAIDIACGVALAAGGFTTAALIDIFGRHKYHALLRPAILTAWLGYTFVAIGLQFDLGRYWNVWRPMFYWQGNSVLFEVGMCVMAYLTVLTVEMSPALIEGAKRRIENNEWGSAILKVVEGPLEIAYKIVKIVLPLFIIAGVVLSCMHQSSLGAVLLIAPTKIHALWYTPIIPLLFLLSAFMVGFPMVIMESIIASRSFGRKPEMDLLTPLAKIVPWFIGIYAIFKFGDLFLRRESISLTDCPRCTIAFLVEIFVGIILPFILLIQPKVRKSTNWLFFSAFLVVIGVALNRINAYLVGYNPPYADKMYFPAIGEIAITLGLICAIMLCYRLCVTFFPILEGEERKEEFESRVSAVKDVSPVLGWTLRGLTIVLMLAFVLIYVMVHREAVSGDIKAFQWAKNVVPVKFELDQISSREHSGRPEGYQNLYLLNNKLLNSNVNYYEPARFTHRTHDVATEGNCAVCHHRFSFSEDDRIGISVREFHEEYDIRAVGACDSCHDMETITISKCSSCHWLPNEEDDPNRLGLKGAYHRQCIGCHEDQPSNVFAPTDCTSCHHPYTPDHSKLVEVKENGKPNDVTANCLKCHEQAGEDVIKTAHWNWKGHSPAVYGHEHNVDIGLSNLMNNYLISVGPNAMYCASCHIGFGCWGQEVDGETCDEHLRCVLCLQDRTRIDCLVCHDTTGTYEKDAAGGGSPAVFVDLAEVAKNVGRPSRGTCGSCHFYSDGGANIKHGDLEPVLNDPPDDFDVHMGRYDMICQDCHKTTDHKIAGRSMSAPATEGRIACERCHGAKPHGITGPLAKHLDNHTSTVACETCHIPEIAKQYPTRVFVDFSKAGEDREATTDEYGKNTYEKNIGEQKWVKNYSPVYQWYDGTRKAYLIGDKINPSGKVVLNAPLGEFRDSSAKIYPFKVHNAVQPYDTKNKTLVVPKFWKGFWEHYDWARAIKEGMEEMELEYSGEFGFINTEMYTGIHHQVVPAKRSLGCADCHSQQTVKCSRCHESARFDNAEHTRMIYPDVRSRMDFKALGYDDDPADKGSRFSTGFGRGTPN